jgi:hypothetical protein
LSSGPRETATKLTLTALARELVAAPRELLLTLEQLDARREPLLSGSGSGDRSWS